MTEKKAKQEIEGADDLALAPETLLQLHRHYTSELRSDLEFTYKYLNFYLGLNSAILAATIAGLLRQHEGEKKGLLLLFGPFLIIGLTIIGYRTIRIFYRRFIEAWLTTVNIEKMLTISGPASLGQGIQEPRFRSSSGSFIAQFERTAIRKALKQAEDEGLTADTIIERVASRGDTLRFARLTFLLFAIVSIALGVVSIRLAFL